MPATWLLLDEVSELSQLDRIKVRYRPKSHPSPVPMNQIVALAHGSPFCRVRTADRRPDKQVNLVLIVLVNQGRHVPVLQIIETATCKWEPLGRQVLDRWRKGDLAGKPRLHCMLIGGGHIG